MGITMAFPADWRGRLARGAGWSVGILFALWVMGGVTPKAIVNETAAVIAGQLKAVFVANDMGLLATKVEKLVGLIRGVLRLLGATLGIPVALLVTRFAAFWLPTTPVLFRRTLWFRSYGRRYRLSVYEIRGVFVAVHPAAEGEVLCLELRDGRTLPLCPVDWSGAGRLYGKIKAAQRGRRARRATRAAEP